MLFVVLEASPTSRRRRETLERMSLKLEVLPTTPISCSCSSFGGVPPESRDSLDMMASLPIGKALGNVEKIDDEFELVELGDSALLLEFSGPEIGGR
jgi:hypothetical protein